MTTKIDTKLSSDANDLDSKWFMGPLKCVDDISDGKSRFVVCLNKRMNLRQSNT